MPWRQQDPRWTESGGVHNYAWEISPPASLLEKSKTDWITSGMQSMDQPCPTSARGKANLQIVRGAYRDNNSSNRRKEKSVNWIKDLPKWTNSTGSTGSTGSVQMNTGLNSVLVFILLLRHIIKAICTMKSSRHFVVFRKKNSPLTFCYGRDNPGPSAG